MTEVIVQGELDVNRVCQVLSLILNCTVTAKKKGVEHETKN
jgi:hypothetical protein